MNKESLEDNLYGHEVGDLGDVNILLGPDDEEEEESEDEIGKNMPPLGQPTQNYVQRPVARTLFDTNPNAFMSQQPLEEKKRSAPASKANSAKKKKKTPKSKKKPDDDKAPATETEPPVVGYTKARFTKEELQDLIDIIDQILPIGMTQWEVVEHDYNAYYPDKQRNMDNLRRQFNKQVKKKAPTGNPNIPKYIHQAKDVQQKIIKKANAVKLGDSDGELEQIVGVPTTTDKELQAANNASKKSSNNAPTSNDENQEPARKRFKMPNQKNQATGTDALLQAFIASESSHRIREEKEERARRRREKRQDKKADRQMKMFFGCAMAAVNAFSGKGTYVDSDEEAVPTEAVKKRRAYRKSLESKPRFNAAWWNEDHSSSGGSSSDEGDEADEEDQKMAAK